MRSFPGGVAWLFLVACGGAPKPASGPEIAARAVASGPAVPVDGDGFLAPAHGILPEGYADRLVAAGAPPHVRLLSPGAEPRSILRYMFKKGDKAHIEVMSDVSMMMAMRTAGDAVPPAPAQQRLPQVALRLTLTATAVDANGTALVEGVFETPTVRGATAAENAELEQELAGMAGAKISYRVTASGCVQDVIAKVDPALSGAVRDAMANVAANTSDFATPLPEAPIGVGAAWMVESRMKSGSLDLFRQTRTTLEAFNGSTVTVKQQLSAFAASETVPLPQPPTSPGPAKARLTDFRGRGTGTTRQALNRLANLEAGYHMNATSMVDAPGGEEPFDFETSVAMDVAIKPIP